MAEYTDYLEQQLNLADKGIARAKKHFEEADVSGKVEALADLKQLEGRHDELMSRIAEAKEKGAENWSAIRASFKEEADALKDTVGSWLSKLR